MAQLFFAGRIYWYIFSFYPPGLVGQSFARPPASVMKHPSFPFLSCLRRAKDKAAREQIEHPKGVCQEKLSSHGNE
jgi:hypothetical protein